MKLTIAMHHRFSRTPDGKIWSWVFGSEFWERYLKVFDSIQVVARALDVNEIPDDWKQSNNEKVSFTLIPYYFGPEQYLLKYYGVRKMAKEVAKSSEALILRGGQISSLIATHLNRNKHPYGVEIIGDPYDYLAPGSIKHPFRIFFRWLFTKEQKRLCLNASVAMYVTQRTLQRRYPCNSCMIGVSDVELTDECFTKNARRYELETLKKISIIMVGTVDHYFKAPDILIDAVGKCIKKGFDIDLDIVGGGKYKEELEERANYLKIGDRVKISGHLPAGELIRNHLDKADIFVLPSRTEGLPRAMVEAMARALPCIGSNVGGIPELLEPADMVKPNDSDELANKIIEIISNPKRMQKMSENNLNKSKTYNKKILMPQRIDFYQKVFDETEKWMYHNK